MTITDPHWPRASTWLAAGSDAPRFAVVGVPTSSASISPSEAWRTPPAVRQALERLPTYDAVLDVDLRDLAATDLGDWPIADLSPDDAVDAVRERALALTRGPVYAFLGGDNVITHPLAATVPAVPLERTGLITLDAHHDVRVEPGQRCNGSPVRALIDEGLPGSNVVQVGIHPQANSREYRRWCHEQGIRLVDADEVAKRGGDDILSDVLDHLARHVDAVHVDLDIDVLDRSFAPACPGARPGGLAPRDLFAAARSAGAHPSVVSVDLVEVDVTRDVADVTVLTVAQTLLAFAAGVATRNGGRT
jgi:formiminoglutamase